MDLTTTVRRFTKVDYLDGLGVAVGADEVSFVHVAKRLMKVSLRHARTLPLPVAGPERLEAFDLALTQFLHDIEVTPDQIVLSMPRRAAFVSRLMVPETARGSLRQIIDYEVERLLPFPKEEIYYDSLTYEAGGEERRLGVVVCGLPRRAVDEYLEVLARAQVRPQLVTLSGAALLSAVAFCSPLSDAPSAVVAVDNGEAELSFIDKKRLVASHLFSLPQPDDPQGDLADLLAQGVARNLPGASLPEMPLFIWGADGALPLTVGMQHQLAALVVARFPVTAEQPLPTDALPALGAALQAVGEDAVGLNLLPVDKRAHREKRLSALTLGLVGLIVILGLVWAVGAVVRERRILGTLTQQRTALEPSVRQVQEQEEASGRLMEQLRVVNEATSKRVLPLLKNLTELIPTDVYLTSLRYKGADVELSGVATRPPSELIGLLENSPCLHNVAPKAPFTKTAQGETFTLGAQVDQCE